LDVYLSIEKSKIERSAKFGGGDAEERSKKKCTAYDLLIQ